MMSVRRPAAPSLLATWLAAAIVASTATAATATNDPLFCIGASDGFAAEFGLVREGFEAFSQVFSDPVIYTVGKSTARDWPFVHPADRDTWAGGKAHTFTIRFPSAEDQQRPLYLVLGLVGAHQVEPSDVTVTVGERPLPAKTAPAVGAMHVISNPMLPGKTEAMIFPVPPGSIRRGDNTISIRLDRQSWLLYDYVALHAENRPLDTVVPPQPDLLAEFRKGPMADVEEIIFAVRQRGKDGHWYANFSYYSHDENRMLYGNGGKLCRKNLTTGEVTTLLDDPQGGVRDPVVDYDARSIVFSYRPGGEENYHLYEIGVDGSGLRQLTEGPFDDIEPAFLPDGDLVFVSSRCKRYVQCWMTKVAVLHRCDRDGRDLRPISANVEHDNTPWPLPDGRILYQRWEYVDRSQVDYHHLWTANPDGTGQMVYYGNMHPGTVMIDAKPIPGTGDVLAIFSPGHGQNEHDGVMTVVSPKRGPDDRSFARTVSRGGSYRDPWAFSDEAFMAASGPQIVLMDAVGRTQVIHQATAEETGVGLELHEPRPLIRRPRERVIPSRIDRRRETGTLVLMDVYEGRNLEGIRRGEIKKLLVLESLPKPINFTGGMDPLTYGGSFTLERVLGTVPVEPDGSACMELPALRSLFLVALDENDLAVKRMQSFLTVQPGEVTSCLGCHEQRTQTLVPGRDSKALKRPPSKIEPYADCPDVFDFPRDVQPILDALCVDCHGYEETPRGGPYAGEVALTGDHGPMFSHAYFTLTVRQLFVDGRDQPVSNYAPRLLGSGASRLLTMLDGSHYDVQAGEHQKRMLRLWIEVGAPYPGTYAALGCGSIGGYQQNAPINTDSGWPTTKAGAEVIGRRCASCHQGNDVLPNSLCDERGISFWRFDVNDPRLKLSRHIVFNLSRPEKSLLLLAPLAAGAGGFGLCRDAQGNAAAVFADTEDPDYRTLLAMATAGKEDLSRIKRFDMPGFRPRPQYLREMRLYGIVPPEHPLDAEVDVYALDRRYWESLWYRAMAWK
ncbi:MAG: hypothetical protein JXB62_15805 [Pirellulales bacterium]|nr:hypothetical protein [Pirellulales bacterium]